jgi:hypothetical protein
MTWTTDEAEALFAKDVDDVIDRARTLSMKERSTAIRDVLEIIDLLPETPERLRALRFIQVALAEMDDRSLPPTLVDATTKKLEGIATARKMNIECRRAALDGLALVFLKASEITPTADASVRGAFAMAKRDSDTQLRGFAAEALSKGGVLSQRGMSGGQLSNPLQRISPPALKTALRRVELRAVAAAKRAARRVTRNS